jgi:hypothetical protein
LYILLKDGRRAQTGAKTHFGIAKTEASLLKQGLLGVIKHLTLIAMYLVALLKTDYDVQQTYLL